MDVIALALSVAGTGALMLHRGFRRWVFCQNEIEIEEPADDGTVRWCVRDDASYCFKCTSWTRYTDDKTQKKHPFAGYICECPEYVNPHFHFRCSSCQYKTIMRAADDRAA